MLLFASFAPAKAQTAFDKKLKSLYKNSVATVTPDELHTLIVSGKSPILLDTRAPEEFDISHLEGAYFLDYGSFNTGKVKLISKDSVIIVYCSVGQMIFGQMQRHEFIRSDGNLRKTLVAKRQLPRLLA